MAEDFNKLKAAYEDLYATLYDDTKGLSVATKLKNARTTYGVDSDQYRSIKAFWDANKAELDSLDKRIKAIRATRNEDKKAFDYTNPKGAKVIQVNEYDEAAAAAIEQGDLKAYTAAVTAGNAIRQEIAAAGYTPPPIPPEIAVPPTGAPTPVSPTATPKGQTPPAGTGGADYSAYVIDGEGRVKSNGKDVVFVETTDASGNIVATPYTTYASARDAFLKQYATPEAIKALQARLLSAGYIKQEDIASGLWATKGVDDLLTAYTVKSVTDVKYGGLKEPIGLDNFLKMKKVGGSGSGGTSKYQVVTTRGDAKKILDLYLTDLIGAKSTPEEEEEFYNILHQAEGKAVQKTVNGVTSGSVFTDEERLLLAAKVARKRLAGTDVGELIKSSTGSQVAINISSLQKTAAAYGVPMTASEALKYVAAGLGQKDFLEKQGERLKLIGKQLHPNLAAHIDAGGTVKDIADVLGLAKSTKLGKVVTDSTYDKDVMSALSRGISVTDFERELQGKEEWRTSPEANTTVNNFLDKIAQSWGLG